MFRLFFAAVLLSSVPVEAQVQRYEIQTIRTKLLRIADGIGAQRLRVEGVSTGPREASLLHFYETVVHPKMDAYLRLDQRHGALNVLIDTGSYINEEEHAQWKNRYEELTQAINTIKVDPEFNRAIAQFGTLAEGLEGELPNYARRLALESALEHFPENMRDTLTEADLLHQEYKAAIRGAPASRGIQEFMRESTDIPRLYKSGEITFSEAQARLDELARRVGGRYVGHEAAEAKGDALNKMAVLKTKLAQSKGFATWSAYQLEASGQGYTPEYRGVANQREFLHAWIEQMRPLVQKYVERRARELNVDLSTLKRHHLSLLTLPDLGLAQPYFPASKLTDIWEQVMLESGFRPQTLAQVIVDDLPREGKNPTMAYMAPLVMPQAEERVLDAATLSFRKPGSMRPGQMYIMQNYRGAGLGDLRTAFHEGMGHALEYLLKEKEDLTSEGYGYVEVPSMTAEYFLRDAQMLFDKATPINGQKPTLAQFKEWVSNFEKNQGVNMLARASSALYDLDLWDYDYTAPGAKTYIERAREVFEQLETLTGQLPLLETGVPAFYGNMATTHFTSGNVRNIGYSYASIGSEMMAQYISRELKKRTGRADWYRQPGLAALITETWYKAAWKEQFPRNIEKVTGEKFDMKKILGELTKDLSCESSIQP